MKLLQYLRLLLYPFSIIYNIVTSFRNYLYNANIIKSATFSIPVITVGNLSTGGTGKTPHIEYLIHLLQHRYSTATLSRGYNRRTKGFVLADKDSTAEDIGDEPLQYYIKYPLIKVAVCEARILGIPHLIHLEPKLEVILLDDAFQHRSVKAGLNILITDFHQPYFNDHLLPAGNLRESRAGARRADIIIVSKCPKDIDQATMQKYKQAIAPLENQLLCFSTIQYSAPIHLFSGITLPPLLADTTVVLLTGIAKPEALNTYIASQAKHIISLRFADHHTYTTQEMLHLKKVYDNIDSPKKIIITTEKDGARLLMHRAQLESWELPIYTLPIQVTFIHNGDSFDNAVLSYINNTDYSPEDF